MARALLARSIPVRTMRREEGAGDRWAAEEGRDRWAFWFLVAFVVQVYTVPAEWIPFFVPLRLALVLSLGALVLMVVGRAARGRPITVDGARGGALLALVLLGALSMKWSVNREATQNWALDLAKVAAIYFVTVNLVTTPRRLRIICATVILASLIPSVGTIQWYQTGENLSEGFRARWFGTYGDPNYLAEFLGVVVPLGAAYVAHGRTGRLFRVLVIAAIIAALTAIVFTHSRGGFLGLVFAMVVWALREHRQRAKALTVTLVLGLGMALFAPKSFWERNETVQDFRDDPSAMGRVHAWGVTSKINLDRPLLGVGGGGFRFAWPDYAPHEAKKALVAHNIFLETLGDLGWVGFLLLLVVVGGAAGGAFEASHDPEIGWLARGLSAAIAGYLFCNCFAGSMDSAHLYLFLGFGACAQRISRTAEEIRTPESVALSDPLATAA